MGDMLNFTIQFHGVPIEKIGTAPVVSPANASGEWGGLFGKVFSGDYQMSVAYWNYRKVTARRSSKHRLAGDTTCLNGTNCISCKRSIWFYWGI